MLLSLAGRLGPPLDDLRAVLLSGTFTAKVGHDFARGVLDGVDATPTLFINEKRYIGPMTVGALSAAIDAAREAVVIKPRIQARA